MRVIKDGYKREYKCTCKRCHSIIGYTCDDTYTVVCYEVSSEVNESKLGIKCPICNNIIVVDFE